HREVAGVRARHRLAVDLDRDAGHEERLADELPPAPGELDDLPLRDGQIRRKRRSVSPEPAAPSSRPVPTMIRAFSSNAIAWAFFECVMWSAGRATASPSTSRRTAATEPASPHKSPSSMKGPRTNQLVAPTSFITSISRRLEKIESRIVFAISSVAETSRMATATRKISSTMRPTRRTRFDVSPPFATLLTPGAIGCRSVFAIPERYSAFRGTTTYASGSGLYETFRYRSGYLRRCARNATSFETNR